MICAVGLLGLLILTSTGCQNDGYRDIRNYYFPLKKITEGLVYEFRPATADSLGPVYWYFRSFIEPDGDVYMTTVYYEDQLLPLQFTRETMVDNGMLLEEMYQYELDSLGDQEKATVEIEAGATFPFQVRDSGGIFLYNIRWASKVDSGATYQVVKNRYYAGDTTYVYQDKKYKAVKFRVKELIAYDKDGVFEQEYMGSEIYANGIGLVAYRKKISEQFVLDYQLYDRYPMEQLEEKFRLLYEGDIDTKE